MLVVLKSGVYEMIYDRYIDLNMYKTFYAVAKSGSFVKASELLYVTQPAISVAIRKLEDQLDIKLLKLVQNYYFMLKTFSIL